MRRAHHIALLLLVLAIMGGCYVSVPLAGAAPATCGPGAGDAVAAAINARRADRDLAALATDPRLVTAAARHTADMAAHDFIGHTGSDGSSLAERIAAAGFVAVRAGEVVASGQPAPDAAVDAWVRSRRHRDVLLLPDVDQVGSACAVGPDGTLFWTVVVGAEPGR